MPASFSSSNTSSEPTFASTMRLIASSTVADPSIRRTALPFASRMLATSSTGASRGGSCHGQFSAAAIDERPADPGEVARACLNVADHDAYPRRGAQADAEDRDGAPVQSDALRRDPASISGASLELHPV